MLGGNYGAYGLGRIVCLETLVGFGRHVDVGGAAAAMDNVAFAGDGLTVVEVMLPCLFSCGGDLRGDLETACLHIFSYGRGDVGSNIEYALGGRVGFSAHETLGMVRDGIGDDPAIFEVLSGDRFAIVVDVILFDKHAANGLTIDGLTFVVDTGLIEGHGTELLFVEPVALDHDTGAGASEILLINLVNQEIVQDMRFQGDSVFEEERGVFAQFMESEKIAVGESHAGGATYVDCLVGGSISAELMEYTHDVRGDFGQALPDCLVILEKLRIQLGAGQENGGLVDLVDAQGADISRYECIPRISACGTDVVSERKLEIIGEIAVDVHGVGLGADVAVVQVDDGAVVLLIGVHRFDLFHFNLVHLL